MEADLNRGARTPDSLKSLPDSNQAETLNRWRLILGDSAEEGLSNTDSYDAEHFKYTEIDEILGYLYNREYGEEQGYRKEGGRGSSNLTVPNWLHKVRELFPKPTVELLEKQALDRYGLTELLTDKTAGVTRTQHEPAEKHHAIQRTNER